MGMILLGNASVYSKLKMGHGMMELLPNMTLSRTAGEQLSDTLDGFYGYEGSDYGQLGAIEKAIKAALLMYIMESQDQGGCKRAFQELMLCAQAMVEHHDVWYMIDDGEHVERTVHLVAAALSFILPSIKDSLAHMEGLAIRPMREALEALREWEAEDEGLLERHVETMVNMEKEATAARKKKAPRSRQPTAAPPDASSKRGRKR